jgi:hypothetical protein
MEYYLQPDEKWNIIYGINSHQEFIDRFGINFYLKPEVHKDIHAIFRVIQNLLVHSYFDYEFMDVAALKAKLSLETALKLRYFELTGEVWPEKKRYIDLIKWFRQRGHFEGTEEGFFNHLRQIRNLDAHPQMHTFAGALSLQNVGVVVDLINDIYEDVEMRKERFHQYESITSHIKKLLEKGAMLYLNSGKGTIIYLMTIGFIDNKTVPHKITFYYKPIFEIPKEYKPSDSIELFDAVKLTCRALNIGDGCISGKDQSYQDIFRLSLINDPENSKIWKDWKFAFDNYKSVMVLFDHVDYFDINQDSSELRTAFHKL